MANSTPPHVTNPGKIHWPTLLASPSYFTLEELAHYSAAGVDPYTVQVTQAICAQFTFSGNGKRNVEAAMRPETSRNVRSLAASQVGYTLLGIIGALSEYYHDDTVASILKDLAESTGLSEELMPTKERWIGLIRLCCGSLSRSAFRMVLDKYKQLDQTDRQLQHASPVVVIEALLAMSRLCRTEEKHLTLFAGKDAGCMAALAEWLFGLKLVVGTGGHAVIRSNCGNDEETTQLTVLFKDSGVPVEGHAMQVSPLTVK